MDASLLMYVSCQLCSARFSTTLTILLLSCHAATGSVYYVTPEDDYQQYGYTTTADEDHPLQHYVKYPEEYFTANTELHLLPGKHYLNNNVIIQDVENFTITGSKIDGMVVSTIHCTSLAGIAVVNCSHTILSNSKMINCANNFTSCFDNTLQHIGIFQHVGLCVLNSSFVSIVEIHLSLQHKASECGNQAINILGKSVLNSIKSNCMEIYYNSIDNTTNVTNELYMENYQIENTANTNKVIKIYLLEFLEDVKIFLHKTTFSGIKVVAFGLFCSGFQGQSIINITECNFLDMQFKTTVIQFKLNDCYNRLGNQSEIYLSHCKFSNNTFQNEKGALVYFQIYEMNEDPWLHIRESLMILIIDCTFHNNHNLIIIVVRFIRNDFGHIAAPIVMIKNIEISDLKLAKNSYAMYFYDVEVYLKGSVVLKYIKSSNDRSAIIQSIGYLHFEKYFEISNSVVEIAFNTSCVYIAEYSVVTFTANIIDTLISNKESFLANAESFLPSQKYLCHVYFSTVATGGI